ncbi:hypothetical protein HGI30_19375 [Paenibacillus albicereus]|uniref:Uncharacterized protein n=1 Tax=Paenibacillus albicereus TaxID=2726185 RepID=A0A6H2H245_9BACL|nr:hypothetical protein [Paenibacillus albicereus]QJC53486.1 hypothetical protein HGI30_19375 [Paenibacillus albicereus]
MIRKIIQIVVSVVLIGLVFALVVTIKDKNDWERKSGTDLFSVNSTLARGSALELRELFKATKEGNIVSFEAMRLMLIKYENESTILREMTDDRITDFHVGGRMLDYLVHHQLDRNPLTAEQAVFMQEAAALFHEIALQHAMLMEQDGTLHPENVNKLAAFQRQLSQKADFVGS